MADLVQTAANVVQGSPAFSDDGIAGEAILAGNSLYLKASDSRWYKSQNDGTAEEAGANGLKIALNSSPGAGQPVKLLRNGQINLGATLVLGETYIVSAVFGAIAPIGDLVSTRYVSILGVATTTAFLTVSTAGPFVSGVQRA